MADPTWGLLAKSMVDNETVEEAIDRLIAVHESDPEAHLGAGESLEQHKAEDVIDHPAGSVLADKWTNSEVEFSTAFDSLDGFFTDGSVFALWPGVVIEPDGTLYANRGEVQIDGESGQLAIDFSKEQMLQFIFSADIGSDGEVYLGMFAESISNIKNGFGVQVIGTTMKFFTGNEAGDSFNYLQFNDFVALETYVVRMIYDPTSELFSCYVDGVLIGTLAWPSDTWTGYSVIRFIAIMPTTSSPVLNVKSVFFKISKPD